MPASSIYRVILPSCFVKVGIYLILHLTDAIVLIISLDSRLFGCNWSHTLCSLHFPIILDVALPVGVKTHTSSVFVLFEHISEIKISVLPVPGKPLTIDVDDAEILVTASCCLVLKLPAGS